MLIEMPLDLNLLKQQEDRLSEIKEYLVTGEASPHADLWQEAIEGILNLLAAIPNCVLRAEHN